MTVDEQLSEWVKGNSLCPNNLGECCPDFSCCQPELLADEVTRVAFANGTKETRHSLLGGFLGAAMEKAVKGKNVYIAGIDDPLSVKH